MSVSLLERTKGSVISSSSVVCSLKWLKLYSNERLVPPHAEAKAGHVGMIRAHTALASLPDCTALWQDIASTVHSSTALLSQMQYCGDVSFRPLIDVAAFFALTGNRLKLQAGL